MRLAKLNRRRRFARSASTRETMFSASSHPGSPTREPSGLVIRQVCTSPQIEKRLAIGPNVPAISGNATPVNHHNLARNST
jgi:hypothetical protein